MNLKHPNVATMILVEGQGGKARKWVAIDGLRSKQYACLAEIAS